MVNSSGTIVAEPEPIPLDLSATALVIIDMQRDFLEPGGFGETLGNDVRSCARAVEPSRGGAARGARAGDAGHPHARGASPRSLRCAARQG